MENFEFVFAMKQYHSIFSTSYKLLFWKRIIVCHLGEERTWKYISGWLCQTKTKNKKINSSLTAAVQQLLLFNLCYHNAYCFMVCCFLRSFLISFWRSSSCSPIFWRGGYKKFHFQDLGLRDLDLQGWQILLLHLQNKRCRI